MNFLRFLGFILIGFGACIPASSSTSEGDIYLKMLMVALGACVLSATVAWSDTGTK